MIPHLISIYAQTREFVAWKEVKKVEKLKNLFFCSGYYFAVKLSKKWNRDAIIGSEIQQFKVYSHAKNDLIVFLRPKWFTFPQFDQKVTLDFENFNFYQRQKWKIDFYLMGKYVIHKTHLCC